jgi:putative endonuclease
MFYIYAIESQLDRRIYVGLTENIEKRLEQHNKGKTKSTKAYCPWVIKYFETASTRLDARKKEKYLKSGVGKEFLKGLIRSRSSMDRIEVS